jgi:hypothetical protein
MVRVEGLKNIADGIYFLKKYEYDNGEKTLVTKFTLKKSTANGIELFENSKDITKLLRSIEIKKNNEIFLWLIPSRIGLRYFAYTCSE